MNEILKESFGLASGILGLATLGLLLSKSSAVVTIISGATTGFGTLIDKAARN